MLVRSKSIVVGCAAFLLAVQTGGVAEAQPRYASKERSYSAVAHYARARAMCVETLEEFEAGRRFARPDLLLDAEEWRLSLISLCEQLNRLVDPKIRISSQGVQVASNPRMVRRSRDRLPEVEDGPQARNDVGEKQRLQEKQDQRARMFAPQEPTPEQQQAVQEVVEQAAQDAVQAAEETIEEQLPEVVDQQGLDVPAEQPQVAEEVATEEELLEQAIEEATAIAQEDLQQNAAEDGEEEGDAIGSLPSTEEVEDDPMIDDDLPAPSDAAEMAPADAVPPLDTDQEIPADDAAAMQDLTEDEQIAIAIEQAIKEKLQEAEQLEAEQPIAEEGNE